LVGPSRRGRLCHRQVVPLGPASRGPAGGAGGMSPSGRCLRSTLGAQRPGGPAYPAGVPISPEKWGERGPGLRPWTPVFIAARSHSLVFAVVFSGTPEGLFLPVFQNRFGTHFPG